MAKARDPRSNSLLRVGFIIGICAVGIVFWMNWYRSQTCIDTSNHLIVGTAADYPPFCFVENEEVVGFDIDVAKAVAAKLGREINIRNIPFDFLLTQAQSGDVHCLAAALSPTNERERTLFFTQPYVTQTPLVIISKNNARFTSLNALYGKRVGVTQGYTSDVYLSAHESHISIVRFNSTAEGIMALSAGSIDAYVTCQAVSDPLLLSKFKDELYAHPLPEANEAIALGISRIYPELSKEIQEAIVELERDGTLADLRKKWRIT